MLFLLMGSVQISVSKIVTATIGSWMAHRIFKKIKRIKRKQRRQKQPFQTQMDDLLLTLLVILGIAVVGYILIVLFSILPLFWALFLSAFLVGLLYGMGAILF